MIVQEVFVLVKREELGRDFRSEAEAPWRGFGVQGKGAAAPLSPAYPCRRDFAFIFYSCWCSFSAAAELRFLRIDSPRISMRWAL